ncbi:UNVERIFIED_CONTAM: hypothetical protein Slati_0389000 [Sesamum latifolium]|uniref:Uncharacterized protein n=1 Tax=Sesamum latifolium TaxID=2727402 RepID=A0AAW2XU45_9LAMI
MSEEKVEEQVTEDFLIDLASHSDNSKSDHQDERGEEEVSSRKHIYREELERRKTDMVVASGVASYRVFHSFIKEWDLDVNIVRFGIPDNFLTQVPAPSQRPHSPLRASWASMWPSWK